MGRITRRSILFVVLAAVVLGTSLVQPQASAGRSRAGVVVQHMDGTVLTDCVPLPKPTISGFQLLKRSRFAYLAASFSFGKQVCWLDGEGCETTDPARCSDCDGTPGFDGNFWAYYIQNRGDTGPRFSNVGATDRLVRRGSLDYWMFGDGSALPEARRFREVCRG